MIFLFKKIWLHITRQRKTQCFIFIFLNILSSLAEIISLATVIPFLGILSGKDKFFDSEIFKIINNYIDVKLDDDFFLNFTLVFIFAALVSGFLRIVLVYLQTKLSYGIGADLSIKVYQNTINQPYKKQLQYNSSEIISTISNKTTIIVGSIIIPILTIISAFIISFSIVSALMIINPILVGSIIFLIASIYIFLTFLCNKMIYLYGQDISLKLNRIVKVVQESFGGIRDIIINNSQNQFIDIYSKDQTQLKKAHSNIKIIASTPRYLIESIGICIIAIVAYVYSQQKTDFENLIPVLGAVALGAHRVLPLLQAAYSSMTSINGGLRSLKDTLYLLDDLYHIRKTNKENKPIQFNNCIKLQNINFKYEDKSDNVLKNVNIKIKKGNWVGIYGKSGSGKSTLVDIILGLLAPSKGSMFIDNTKITFQNVENWQLNIAHVPQAIFLADNTIAENISFGSKNKTDLNKVEIAAHKAKISKSIINMKNKYGTFVGEKGIKISGGQRQRIAIARAFYKNAKVIVFDEATNALDQATENEVIDSIKNEFKNFTIIMISHNIKNLKYCNQILEVKNNTVFNLK